MPAARDSRAMKQCARNGCPLAGAWKVSVLVWGDGTDRESGVPLEIETTFAVCTGHREDGKPVDIINARVMRKVGAQLRAEHKPPADWRTAEWKYVRDDGGLS